MSQTKTWDMIYSPNVSEISETFEVYIMPLVFLWDIRGTYHNSCFCLRHSRSISYPLFLSETFEEYTITLVFVWDIRGVYHTPCFWVRHSRSISYPLFLSGVMIYSSTVSDKKKGYDILLDVLRRTDGLWYTPGMAQTNTKGMIYSSNVSHKNKCYGILLECLRQRQGVWYTSQMSQTKTRCMIYSANVSDKDKGYGILLECLTKKGVWYTTWMFSITLVFVWDIRGV
jgi:hypothetical protein